MADEKRQLIANADDFGLSRSINLGIVKGFREGLITQASIMANAAWFNEAVELAREHSLPLAIHFNLTEGRPCVSADRVSSLVNKEGKFRGKRAFWARTVRGAINPDHVHMELDSQLKKCFTAGIGPIRIDSHHHVHLLPQLQHIFQQVMENYGILGVRWISWPRPEVGGLWSAMEQTFVRMVTGDVYWNTDARTTDYFFGLEFYRTTKKKSMLLKILKNLPPGLSELMCHPELACNGVTLRGKELEALCSAEAMGTIADRQIELVDSNLGKKCVQIWSEN